MKDQLKEDAEFMQDRLDFAKIEQEKFVSELIELGFVKRPSSERDYTYELDDAMIWVDVVYRITEIFTFSEGFTYQTNTTIEQIKNLLKALQC